MQGDFDSMQDDIIMAPHRAFNLTFLANQSLCMFSIQFFSFSFPVISIVEFSSLQALNSF